MIFHPITAEDGRWARPLLEAGGYHSCEYAFVNLFVWSELYKTQIARFDNMVIARSESGSYLRYLFPVGMGSVAHAVDAILDDAQKDEQHRKLCFFSLSKADKALLEKSHLGVFSYEERRDEWDYIYSSGDLAQLPGKKYQKKRNHCSRFERSYPNWAFHEITPDVMKDILAFNNRWRHLYDNQNDIGIAREHRAIELACEHYTELQLKGGYITVDGEIVAFSYGSPLGKDTFVTHVEKALYDVPGAYNIINREMARHFCSGYLYINREDDVGEDGLREAKLSYHPAWLEEKFAAELAL